jgi:Flp pilus assembly protein TadG
MRLSLRRDERGTSTIEFAMAAPAFAAILLGILEGGLMLWTQFGLQHGVEMAARCASINKGTCGSEAAIQTYAVNQALGVNPPASTFTVASVSCGNRVSASYSFQAMVTLKAEACFPQ